MAVRTLIAALALVGTGAAALPAPMLAELKPATMEAYQRYIRRVEADVDRRIRGEQPFLWSDSSQARLARLRRGDIVTERTAGNGPVEVPDGLVHDWSGAVFVPGVNLHDALTLLQNYDGHKSVYPEVADSKLLSRNGDQFSIFLRLKKKKFLVTVVLNTTHDAQYFRLDATRGHSRSHATRITQVDNPGERDEREMPPGDDSGYMWALNSYWRFAARDGGVYLECQAVSLSRRIPTGLGWLVGPLVNDLPGESLAGTLSATRAALTRRTVELHR